MVEVSTEKIYKYDISEEDGVWLVRIPELGLLTQAQHLRDTDRMARSIISLHLECDPAAVNVHRSNIISLPSGVADAVKRALAARGRFAEVQATANEATIDAAQQLIEEGVTFRDAGYLLGLSHQRIAQLLSHKDNAALTH